MKRLTNLLDPTRPDAELYIRTMINKTRLEAWNRQQEWLKDKIIGEPQATSMYTVEQLKLMGMVGVYTAQ